MNQVGLWIVVGLVFTFLTAIAIFMLFFHRKYFFKYINNVKEIRTRANAILFKVDWDKQQVIFNELYGEFNFKRIWPLNRFLSLIISDNYVYLRSLLSRYNAASLSIGRIPLELNLHKKLRLFVLNLLRCDEDKKILYCRLDNFSRIVNHHHENNDDQSPINELYLKTLSIDADLKNDFVKYSLSVNSLMAHKKKYNYLTGFCFSIKNYYLVKRYHGPSIINFLQDCYLYELKKIFKGNFAYIYLNENNLFVLTNKFNSLKQINTFIEKLFFRLLTALGNNDNLNFNLNLYTGAAFLNTQKFTDLSKIENAARIAQNIAYDQNTTFNVIDIKKQLPGIVYSSGLVQLKTQIETNNNIVDLLPYQIGGAMEQKPVYYVKPSLDLNPLLQYDNSALFFDKYNYYDVSFIFLDKLLKNTITQLKARNELKSKILINVNFNLAIKKTTEIINIIHNAIKNLPTEVILVFYDYFTTSISQIKLTLNNFKVNNICCGLGDVNFFSKIKQILLFSKPDYIVYTRELMRRFEKLSNYCETMDSALNFYNTYVQFYDFAIFCKSNAITTFTPAKSYMEIKNILLELIDYPGLKILN